MLPGPIVEDICTWVSSEVQVLNLGVFESIQTIECFDDVVGEDQEFHLRHFRQMLEKKEDLILTILADCITSVQKNFRQLLTLKVLVTTIDALGHFETG